MIRLSTPRYGDSTAHHIAPTAIATITEAGTSSQWHGIRSYVKLFDGTVLEVSETAAEVGRAVKQAAANMRAIPDWVSEIPILIELRATGWDAAAPARDDVAALMQQAARNEARAIAAQVRELLALRSA